MNGRKTGSLVRDTRGLTSAEWLIIGALLLLGAGAAFQLVSDAINPKGDQVAGIIATGQGDVGAGGPGSVGGPGSDPGYGSMPGMGGALGLQAYQLGRMQALAESVGGFFTDMFKGAIYGDFNDESSWGATIGQTLIGFVPIAGQIGDVRDTISAIKDVYNGEEGAWKNLGIAAVAWVPGVGDAAKGVLRGADNVLRSADNVGDVLKHADDVAKSADEVAQNADEALAAAGVVARRQAAEEAAKAEAARIARQAAEAEPKITAALQKAAAESDGRLVGLDFRLKTEESLTRKLRDQALEAADNGATGDMADIVRRQGANISDAVRYTVESDASRYASTYEATVRELQSQGNVRVKSKNTWGDTGPYRGINEQWVTPDGQRFEVQFHTPESFHTKETLNHKMYEEARLSTTSPERRAELEQAMIDNANKIPVPPGATGLGGK